MASSGTSLRKRQIDALVRLLSFNESGGPSSTPLGLASPGKGKGRGGASSGGQGGGQSGSSYKVLVLDSFTRDVITPLLRLNDLRKCGVTLYLLIDSERQNVPDVPAVYFVRATDVNVSRVTQDLAVGTYDVAHLNFCAPLSDKSLQDLASGLTKQRCLGRVAKLFDQNLAFVALEKDLFSLMIPKAYVALNDPSAKDVEIEKAIGDIIDGLFCAIATWGSVPIIRCQRGGAAEHVARALDGYIRKHLEQRSNAFSSSTMKGGSFQRPLLVLFDRNFDLTPQIQHCWTYHAMVHDVLGLKLGRTAVASENPASGGSTGSKKSYDVGPGDFFWEENGGRPFPKVAEEVEEQLNKYKKDMAAINTHTSGAGEDEDDNLQANTKNLMNAVSSLPELTERKRVIDKHTNIATALLKEIKDRQIDNFVAVEEELFAGKADKSAVLKVITTPKGLLSDKLRLVATWLLTCETLPSAADFEEIDQCLKGAGADLEALNYLKRLRNLSLTGAQRSFAMPGSAGSSGTQGNILDFADKFVSKGLDVMAKGMKNLMSQGQTFAVTRAVQALVESKGSGEEQEKYLYFDPKLPRGTSPASSKSAAYRDVMVCIIGGGNYLEYHSLQEMSQRVQPKCNVVYGATEMLAPCEFLQQLTELGNKGK
ncbi:Sec1-family transport protein [Chloropicon primus]|uniref:Sec1-family transport protein n=2 Tax=Chloropicon primus TaxID=1764295 RepID=A0A5B8MSW7_9CHLO|nr:Sec1-family transport protein [Chloropicon primus]|eukprot:QDZ22924.1 Sec1-family transport protein [Chloropicon primus]